MSFLVSRRSKYGPFDAMAWNPCVAEPYGIKKQQKEIVLPSAKLKHAFAVLQETTN